ncbi:type II toxin-antitoxin system RelE/ParE family toxin [Nodosilinea sp. LEGE 07088]|uniref:type II toxin-antitoxin system RelE/ParE family toxin n=1 Tax=Nodosilinea sp. LEGE 07088 TaxID=2777968 RepID=UPI00187F1D69|nr:type II toxin-antitoxin system RelE/ParE family toxin [Nodosilinea sp. LEGE 07088]MBE9138821.1 type II toxin-antitoxin system RelE/ParE family toxin [Nodosilinea sp. LEGE 07088]
MKPYRFLTPALLEVEAAAQFYESNRPDLGREFLDEIDGTIQRILLNPKAWKLLDGEIRRCRLRKFPYGIVYTLVKDDFVLIISVMHLHRHPSSWRKNLRNDDR